MSTFKPMSHWEMAVPDAFSVAIIEADSYRRECLTDDLGDPRAAVLASVEQLEDQLPLGTPVVALLGPSCADTIGLTSVERLTRLRPEVAVVLVVDELTTDVLQRALRAGVRDVLAAPVPSEQLRTAVSRLAVAAPQAGTVKPSAREEGPSGPLGRVVVVFSTKGGAGKSMVASNVAVSLARRSDRPVVLVDADLQFGDVAVMLKLAPQHTIVDAVNAFDRLDSQLLQSLLIRHEPSGLYVLPAPLEPAFADQVGSAQMARIVALLREFAGHVVVDTPAYFNDVVLGLIEGADDVLLVAGMDIPNIKNVKIGLQTLRLLNIPLTKVKLVLNRANSKVKLDVSEVERTLQIKAQALIPSDVLVPQSVNKGTPIVLDAPKSSVTKAIEELAGLFVVEDAVPTGKRRR